MPQGLNIWGDVVGQFPHKGRRQKHLPAEGQKFEARQFSRSREFWQTDSAVV
jgi:hypothetical protein